MRSIHQCGVFVSLATLLIISPPSRADDYLPREQRVLSQSQIEDAAIEFGAAPPSQVRPLLPLAPNLIMSFEGWEPVPYDDPSGYCTVGYGHLIEKKECSLINLARFSKALTKTDGAKLLDEDTRTARAAIQSLVKRDLKDHEFGALASFVFNVGKGNFAESTLLKLLNDGLDAAATKEFSRWIVSDKKVLPGLVARRSCEQALFKNQLKGRAGEFVRSECDSLGATFPSAMLVDIVTGQEIQVGGN
jgi:lysozyme